MVGKNGKAHDIPVYKVYIPIEVDPVTIKEITDIRTQKRSGFTCHCEK